MQYSRTPISLTILLIFTLTTNFLVFTAQARPAEGNRTKPVELNSRNNPNVDSRSHKTKQSQVSDQTAYELFLRTVGENNARSLVKKGNFAPLTEFLIVNEAKRLSEQLNSLDQAALKLNSDLTKSKAEQTAQLDDYQREKERNLTETINGKLLNNLKTEEAQKMQEFIETEVKPNIQVIPVSSFGLEAGNKSKFSFVKASTKTSAAQTKKKVYLYSASWDDGENIFGSGTLSEEFQSQTSYLVTVTVTSPSGRTNVTTGDWSLATITNSSGLSMIGTEDGTYNIQATFEQQEGSYDEWGNFIGTGLRSAVGTSTTSIVLAPFISLNNLQLAPAQVTNRAGNRFSLLPGIGYSNSVPVNTTYDAGLNVVGNGSNIVLNLDPLVSTPPGALSNISSNRREFTVKKLTANQSQQQIEFPYAIGANSGTGTVSFVFAIFNARNPSGDPVEIQVSNRTRELSITPAPSPTPGGGNIAGGCFNTIYTPGPINSCGVGFSGTFQGTGGGWVQCCPYSSPLLLDIDGDGFEMTDYYQGVPFDINGAGNPRQVSWTAAGSDDAWLVLDRDENNRIDSGLEMFGDASEQPDAQNPRNGFASLAVFDKANKGGNNDGKITRRDQIFRKLRLWQDRNHNGVAEPEELSRLPALDVVAVFLDYQESRRTDQYGNRFKFRARIRDAQGANVGRWAWDVFLVIAPPAQTSGLSCPLDGTEALTESLSGVSVTNFFSNPTLEAEARFSEKLFIGPLNHIPQPPNNLFIGPLGRIPLTEEREVPPKN